VRDIDKAQKIYIVTGKGGVGKSTVAAALAQKLAAAGSKTILVELGEQSYFEHIYKIRPDYSPIEVKKNLFLSIWSGERCLHEYVQHLVKVKKIAELFFENKIMKTFLRAAPALKELAILGKATSGVRHWGPRFEYDSIIIDAYSSGHLLALLSAPIGMAEIIDRGPMGEQSKNIIEVLRNKKIVEYWIVTLPEELPVTEAIELKKSLINLVGVVPKIICNKVYESPIDLAVLESKRQSEVLPAAKKFLDSILQMLHRQAQQLGVLEAAVGDVHHLPLVLSPDGQQVIDLVAGRLR
jgi:anion-transporting  ArsA/GET3 family ATPase